MAKGYGQSNPRIEEFVRRTYEPEDDTLAEIRRRCGAAGLPEIQMSALDALHVQVLARACGAKRAIEIGTLGGYSGIALLRGLDPTGFLHTFEIDERHAAVAQESFHRSGFGGRVRIHVGPALERLRDVEDQGPFDLVLVDADKESYAAYVEWAAEHLRTGGVVLCDNAFLFGHVIEEPEGAMANEILGMRRAHEILARSGRFQATVLPTGEGLALGVKVS